MLHGDESLRSKAVIPNGVRDLSQTQTITPGKLLVKASIERFLAPLVGEAVCFPIRRDADAVAVAAVYDRRGQIGDSRSPLQFVRELFFQLLLPIVQRLQMQLPASP